MKVRISLLAAALIALEALAQPKGPPPLPPQAAEKAQAIVPGKTAPAVSLSAPAAGALYTAPASVALEAAAAASSAGRSIARVEFFAGATLIGVATTAPYTVSWGNVTAGSYSLTARATDNLGVTATSAPVAIIVNAPPTVALTSPSGSSIFTAPAAVTLAAAAFDPDGTVTQVEFFQGSTLLATVTGAPYAFETGNLAGGSYSFTARAKDNRGAATTSAPVAITVNVPPSVSLAAPIASATFKAPAEITLTAEVTDTDGTIAQVQFFNSGTLIGSRTAPPYSIVWSAVPQGSYSLSARVTDNHGAVTSSAPVGITVTPAMAQIHFIHTDHLNTPRLITNEVGQVVWSWANDDPFGANVPNENPSGLGIFTCNLRLPGQYFDRETSLLYNYFRDYEPAIGRYLQFDPIGLQGGINGYAYAGSNPLSYIDPEGLKALVCCRVLNSVAIGTVLRQRHCYLNVDGTTYGLYPEGKIGVPRVNDPQDRGGTCKECQQLPCSDLKTCIKDQHDFYPIGTYDAVFGPNSNTYAGTIVKACCKGGLPSGLGSAPRVGDNPPTHNPPGRGSR